MCSAHFSFVGKIVWNAQIRVLYAGTIINVCNSNCARRFPLKRLNLRYVNDEQRVHYNIIMCAQYAWPLCVNFDILFTACTRRFTRLEHNNDKFNRLYNVHLLVYPYRLYLVYSHN